MRSSRSQATRSLLTVLVLGALALVGCGRKPLPPLSAMVDAPYLRAGSTWTYRVEDTSFGRAASITLTFEKDDVYKGIGVLSFTAGNETLLYDRDLNFVAAAAGGKVLREASPSLRAFDFPFYVGKEWRDRQRTPEEEEKSRAVLFNQTNDSGVVWIDLSKPGNGNRDDSLCLTVTASDGKLQTSVFSCYLVILDTAPVGSVSLSTSAPATNAVSGPRPTTWAEGRKTGS